MNFKEYTAAARVTAVYPEQFKCVYPALGIVEEVAEFAEKFEDWYIGKENGWISKYTRDDVILELSDILWFFAIFCDDNYLDMEVFFETDGKGEYLSNTLIICGKLLGVVQKATRKNEFPISAAKLAEYLDHIAGEINYWCDELNVTIEEVMEINITKLRDRQARNVIKGSGDKR